MAIPSTTFQVGLSALAFRKLEICKRAQTKLPSLLQRKQFKKLESKFE